MRRVVVDSNVFVSALIFGGNPRRLIHLAEQDFVELYTSELLRGEVERVLAIKFQWPSKRVASATNYLWSLTKCVEPQEIGTDCVDSDDNRVLECAVEAQADWIVTGDQHLLVLHPYRGIAIVTPREFLDSKGWKRSDER